MRDRESEGTKGWLNTEDIICELFFPFSRIITPAILTSAPQIFELCIAAGVQITLFRKKSIIIARYAIPININEINMWS